MATFRDLDDGTTFVEGIGGNQPEPDRMSRRESMAFWLVGSAVTWAALFAAFMYFF